MRAFSTLIDKTAKMRQPGIPGDRLDRVQPAPVSRFDEGIIELFEHACIVGDLEMATDLTILMERRHARSTYDDAEQERLGGVHVKRMRGELDRRYIMKGIRPPCPELRPRWHDR